MQSCASRCSSSPVYGIHFSLILLGVFLLGRDLSPWRVLPAGQRPQSFDSATQT
jgi:hypothetical protein